MGTHTYDEEEVAMFSGQMNEWLADDPDVKDQLPLKAGTDDLFEFCKGGIALCKLINVAVPGTIDERAIKLKAKVGVHAIGCRNCQLLGGEAGGVALTVFRWTRLRPHAVALILS